MLRPAPPPHQLPSGEPRPRLAQAELIDARAGDGGGAEAAAAAAAVALALGGEKEPRAGDDVAPAVMELRPPPLLRFPP